MPSIKSNEGYVIENDSIETRFIRSGFKKLFTKIKIKLLFCSDMRVSGVV